MGEMLKSHGVTLVDDEILQLFAKLESRIEAGKFHNYKTVLAKVAEGFGQELDFIPRQNKEGFGATPAAKARPDMELSDLLGLASRVGLS